VSRGGETRFRKGQSGNPKGRPRTKSPATSAFDVIFDKMLSVTQNGVERELTVEEALQQRTYQDALAGNRSARREVLKMIARREEWLVAKTPGKPSLAEIKLSFEGRTADEALVLLGIASQDVRPIGLESEDQVRLKLEPWVTQVGLDRGRRRTFSDKDIADIRRCTRDPEEIDWP
jgi:hypothetical protein